MSESILNKVKEQIEAAKKESIKHIVFEEQLPNDVAEKLRGEGYGVYEFGKSWVISWAMPTGRISGKMSIDTIIRVIQGITGSSRNILCQILTL